MATANARFARRFLMRELIYLPHLADLPDEVVGLLNECSMTDEYAPNIASMTGMEFGCLGRGGGSRPRARSPVTLRWRCWNATRTIDGLGRCRRTR
jgi:hypothetical protein